MDEYIKRDDALQVIESCAGWSRPLESAYEDIQAIPAADVAPVVHGKWENVPGNGVYDTICTYCGFHLGIRFYPSEYCPNCGAKMDKEGT